MDLTINLLRGISFILVGLHLAACAETRYYAEPKPASYYRATDRPNSNLATISVRGPDAHIRKLDGGLTITEERLNKFYEDHETGPAVKPIQWPRSVQIIPGPHLVEINSLFGQIIIAVNAQAGHRYEISSPESENEFSLSVIDKTSGETIHGWRPGAGRRPTQ